MMQATNPLCMLPVLESLLILQDRDQKISNLRKDLAKVPRDKERADAKLNHNKQAVADAKLAYQHNEVAIKKLELDIATRKDTIVKLKTRQFETKKNDEYTTLAAEVIRYGEMVDALENQELELMEQAENLKDKLKLAEDALAVTQKEVDADIALLDTKAVQYQSRLDEVIAERSTLAENVDSSVLALYERLLKSKGIDPVVPLNGPQCGGCHMKVTPTTFNLVQAEKEITQCENCGRLLYIA